MGVPGDPVAVTAKPFDAQAIRVSDRSLDEFVAASAGADEPADTDPSVPTMRWSADGVACDACGAVVSRRWLDDEESRSTGGRAAAFVCTDCKEW